MNKKMISVISCSLILGCISTQKDVPEIPKVDKDNIIKIISLETNTNEQEITGLKRYAEGYVRELMNWFIVTKKIVEKNNIEFANKMSKEDKQFIKDELEKRLEDYNKNLFIKDDAYREYTLNEKKLHFLPLMAETSFLYSRAESIKNAYDEYMLQNKNR
ncbi:hypothetical protein LKV13_02105 [Borrelia sp. BU AG58]|uniref:hypothetical protein n=1 Tax=Borrelia sp. BU AG58 TaxID=2887345 RepID=UPI001E57A132|nr:hypothetical protein [Borrelia sp. BU AG58]UER67595.1 hypothetical protein LKV13_02105 [Borrelia sp. BU AG58]